MRAYIFDRRFRSVIEYIIIIILLRLRITPAADMVEKYNYTKSGKTNVINPRITLFPLLYNAIQYYYIIIYI